MNNNLEVRLLIENEYEIWDEFIMTSPQGCIFNYSWWLEAVTQNDFRILVILREKDIIFGMPLPYYSTGVVQKPKLTQTLGVLFSPFETDKLDKILEIQKKYINIALDYLDDKIKSYRMYFHSMYDYWLPFKWKGFVQTTRYTYRIVYKDFKNCEELRENYSSNKKRNIKRGYTNGVKVEHTDDFDMFFKINEETFSRQNMNLPYTYDFYKTLDCNLTERGRRLIINAVLDGEVIASAYFIYDDNCAYYLASGARMEYRDVRAQDILLDYGIQYFYSKVNIFDFEGSMIEGIERSFRAFGGKPTQYFEIRNS